MTVKILFFWLMPLALTFSPSRIRNNFWKTSSVFRFLAVAEVQCIYYAHHQNTTPWDILVSQDFCSLHDNGCHPVIWSKGRPVTTDGNLLHVTFKAGFKLFIVLVKQKKKLIIFFHCLQLTFSLSAPEIFLVSFQVS